MPGAFGDVARDFVEVELHHVQRRRRGGQHEGRPERRGPGRSRRTDRRCRSAGRRAALAAFPRRGPLPNLAVPSGRCGPRLQTRFRPATSSRAGRRDEPSARAGSFFLKPRRSARPELDDVAAHTLMWEKPSFLKELSDIARMKVDAEPLGDDAFEVDPRRQRTTPSFSRSRTRLDDLRELSQLLRRKTWLGTLRPSCRRGPPDPKPR